MGVQWEKIPSEYVSAEIFEAGSRLEAPAYTREGLSMALELDVHYTVSDLEDEMICESRPE